MDFADYARAFFALLLTLGLIGLGGVALRRLGPDALARLTRDRRARRRLKVVETLVLDPARRLVLVSCDGEEQLLLLGEGRLITPTGAPATIPDLAPAPDRELH